MKPIFSEQVLSVSVTKDFFSGIFGMFGKKLESYAVKYRRAREIAICDLENQAKQMHADDIADLRVCYNQFVNSEVIFITVMAYGTAIVFNDRINL